MNDRDRNYLNMNRPAVALAANTFAHFSVDFACFFMLFAGFAAAKADPAAISLGFLTYNVVAFGLQPVIGHICDAKKRLPIGIIGCILTMTGLFLLTAPWLALLICALGNACFHVGGGIDSLINAGGRMSRSGIFVSSGVVGLALGTLAGKSGTATILLPVTLLLISAISLVVISPFPSIAITTKDRTFRITPKNRPFSLIILLAVFSIIIRSFVGSSIPIDWRSTTFLLLLPAFASGLGKASGGFLADRFGARTVGTASLLVSIPLLAFGFSDPVLCTVGIVLFNISMPITLCAIFAKLLTSPGLAFGITTLGLLIGNIPTFFIGTLPINLVPYLLALMILLSAASLSLAVINQPRRQKP